MAELIPWQKPVPGEEPEQSVGNWRQDHPHFQDVQRTVYAKGEISDFKKVRDDPIEVEPMVKVKIEGYDEFDDYIPLFFHPKPQYWDGDAVKATDFDQEQKFFKRAWMSFRCGDEVVVLLQATKDEPDLKPKAVIGFIDNYPRIGENAFKVMWVTDLDYCGEANAYEGYYCAFGTPDDNTRMARYGELNAEPEPPGDIALNKLGLLGNYKKTTIIESSSIDEGWQALTPSGYGGGLCCQEEPGYPPGGCYGYNGTIDERGALFKRIITKTTNKADCYFFPVGPILFCYKHSYTMTEYSEQIYLAYFFKNWPELSCSEELPTEEIPSSSYVPPNEEPWTWIQEVGHSGNFTFPIFGQYKTWDYSPWEPWQDFNSGKIYAQVFTPELWEALDINQMIGQATYGPTWEWEDCIPGLGMVDFLLPPHTREELIEAGFIKEDGTLPEEEAA